MPTGKATKPTKLSPKTAQQQLVENFLNPSTLMEHCSKLEIHVHINGNNIVMGSDHTIGQQNFGDDIAISSKAKGGKQ